MKKQQSTSLTDLLQRFKEIMAEGSGRLSLNDGLYEYEEESKVTRRIQVHASPFRPLKD